VWSVIACDDGMVRKVGGGYTVVACILWVDGPVDVELNLVKVDGLEASSTIAFAVTRLMLRNGVVPKAVLLDSLTIAGFNVASPPTIAKLTGVPVIIVYKYRPSSSRFERASKHFADWGLRMRVLRLVDNVVEVSLRKGKLYILTWGISLEDAIRVIEGTQIHSRTPEPLRLAHRVASEVTRFMISSGQWLA